MSQVNPIKVNFPISEQEYLQASDEIKEHQATGHAKGEPDLQLILGDGTTYKYPGHFYRVDREVNIQTGTIEVQGLFPNPDAVLRPGQYAKIRAANKSQLNALMVPQRAVQETQGQYQVAVVGSDNIVSIRTVKPGDRVGSLWIITDGVKPGEHVITQGLQKVKDGMQVIAQDDPAAVASPSASGALRRAAIRRRARNGASVGMSRFFIDRPIVAMVIAIVFVIAGAVMILRLPVAQFPDIVPPKIQTTAIYTGADALTVEQSVATPIEEQVNGAKNMIYMQSISGADGTMTLQVSFEVGTDVDLDQVQVQNRLAQATSSLPTEVNNYGLTTQQTVGIPLLVYAISSPKRTWDQTFLSNYVAINIEDELARIPGIGQVKIFGAANYAMRVWVAPDTLAKLQLTVNDIANAIAAQNVVNPAGRLGDEPAPPGQQFTYTVRAQGRLMSADEFGDIILRANPDGSLVRLKDVGRIELGAESYTQQATTNGAPAAVVLLYQNPGSNALEAATKAKRKMKELVAHFPPDMESALTLDTTIPITEGAREIVKTLLEAIALVILVVFIFLQSWRATLIPILTVPVSLVGAFLFFPAVGFTTNSLSLLGLVLAVGLVVDDAIVVVEAIEVKIAQGKSPREAAIEAMDEVGGALVGIALVLSAVFIPAAFLVGITGSLYRQFALTIAFSVIVSAFNALTLSPALGALLLKPRDEQSAQGAAGAILRWFNRGFARITDGYTSICSPAHSQTGDRDTAPGRLHRAGRRPRQNRAEFFPARRGSGLLHHERSASRGGITAADRGGDESDRRDPQA